MYVAFKKRGVRTKLTMSRIAPVEWKDHDVAVHLGTTAGYDDDL
jgi:hypothetical protein